MPAITIFDSIDEVPETLKDKATEVEGKFHVPADALVSKHNEVLAEKKREAAERARLQKEYDKFKDLDPEKARQALQQIADAEAEKLRTQGDWDAREKAINSGWQEKEAAWTGEKTNYETALNQLVIENEIARAGALPGVDVLNPKLLHLAIKHTIRRNGMDYEILAADGSVRYGNDGKPLRMEAYLKELRENPEISMLFKASGASGSGAPANTGGAGGKQLKRSEMSASEKAQYVKAHGKEKYLQLPE